MRIFKQMLTTIAMLLCSIIANAHDFEVDGIYYNILSEEDKTVEVTYKGYNYNNYSDEYTGAVVIPVSVKYNEADYGVTSIGSGAFARCSSLTSIIIPNSVTSIGSGAFEECSGLTSIIIPNSVTSIGSRAFEECSSLTSITIPNSVTSIGGGAFGGCKSLTSITIPNSVTSIEGGAFVHCSSLTSITIPNSVTSIGDSAFDGCKSLTSVTIGNSVTSIGSGAFYGCEGLTSITIPNSVTSIGGICAFAYCSNLTSITIGNSVTSIGESAFDGCSSLKEVINFSNLTFSKGSNNHGYIAYYANKVINAPNGTIVNDFVFCTQNEKNRLAAYLGNEKEITLPENYKGEDYYIGEYAFSYCDSVTSITIPNSVTSIGGSAFSCCI